MYSYVMLMGRYGYRCGEEGCGEDMVYTCI